MSTTLVEVRAGDTTPDWHQQFLAQILPAVEASARRRFRTLPVAEREESTAEAIAGALVAFVRLIKRGKDPVAFAGRLALVAVLRVAAGRLAGSSDNSNDPMSRYARQRKGIQIESLGAGSTRTQDGWESILVEDGRITPCELAASRIDFREWLGRMKRRHRQIAEALALGYRTDEMAEKFGLSCGRISQLRREFENSWREFQREAPRNVDDQQPVGSAAA